MEGRATRCTVNVPMMVMVVVLLPLPMAHKTSPLVVHRFKEARVVVARVWELAQRQAARSVVREGLRGQTAPWRAMQRV